MGISHTLAPIDATKSQTPNATATAKDIRRKCTKTAVSRSYVKTCLGRRKEQTSRKNPRLSTTAGSTSGGRKDEMLISKTKAFFFFYNVSFPGCRTRLPPPHRNAAAAAAAPACARSRGGLARRSARPRLPRRSRGRVVAAGAL